MTLKSIPRYDGSRIADLGERAVVVGGSVAGLAAARVLADAFETVTIVERDPPPDGPTPRRGVPQGRHIHALLKAGRATLSDLLPGFGEDLLSAGGLQIDMLSDVLHYDAGGFLADGPTVMPTYYATRPLFEHVVRRRVADHERVELRSGCHCTGYLAADDAGAVEGVTVREGDSPREELPADLVVDATGRASRTPTWLEDNGYASPQVDEVRIDVAYSTAVLERPPSDRRAFFVAAGTERGRGAGVFPVEDDRWYATFFGVHGDHPPTDPEGLSAFAASLPGPDLAGLLEERPWAVDGIDHYPFPSSRRYRYAGLDRFPDGLAVVGDAIASFNPIYGQGMSVAILEALQLHHALAASGVDDLPRQFFGRAQGVVDTAWSLSVGADFAFPETTGPKPRGTDLLNRYVARLARRARADGVLREAFYRVLNLEEPPESLLRPGVLWRVLGPTGSAGGDGIRSEAGATSRRGEA